MANRSSSWLFGTGAKRVTNVSSAHCSALTWLLFNFTLVSRPRLSELGSLCRPAQGQIGQIAQAWVFVDRMMEARDDRTAAIGHAVAQKLPGAVVFVMGDVGNGFRTL